MSVIESSRMSSEIEEDPVFTLHKGGKIEVNPKAPLTMRDLSMAYTPGVAPVSLAIHEDADAAGP